MNIAALVISEMSAVIATISVVIAIKANAKADIANQIAQGQIEISIQQMIFESKRDLNSILIAQLDKNPELSEALLKTSRQSYLNALEEACTKYLDGKVDRKRFKKSYSIEIRQAVTSEAFKLWLNPPNTSSYQALLKTYDEWNNLEQ